MSDVRILLTHKDLRITFCVTCAFCGTKADGSIDGPEMQTSILPTLMLKSGWGMIATDGESRVWCGDCNPAK